MGQGDHIPCNMNLIKILLTLYYSFLVEMSFTLASRPYAEQARQMYPSYF